MVERKENEGKKGKKKGMRKGKEERKNVSDQYIG